MSKKNGYLITLEGGEGSGKSSAGERLYEHLSALGLDVYYFHEPGSTTISEQIRRVLKDGENKGMVSKTEALLFQAARAQFCEEVLWPVLEKEGSVVISDRFFDSSVSYQGFARGLGREKIRKLSNWSTGGIIPDLTFFLDVDVEVGLARKKELVKADRLDGLDPEFHEKVREGYLSMVKENEAGRWVKIDANKSKGEVAREVIAKTEEKLIASGYIERPQGRLERR